MVGTTFITFLSWSRLRIRQVRPEKLSNHALRLYFDHADIAPYYVLKVSEDSLLEWHSFAVIPGENRKGFSVLVSKGKFQALHLPHPVPGLAEGIGLILPVMATPKSNSVL